MAPKPIVTYRATGRKALGRGAVQPSGRWARPAELLNALGQELKPKVLCLSDLGNTGAGHPDFGLFAANQVQKGEPRPGQAPERGVIEVKSAGDDAWLTADTAQVSKYFGAYRLVIVTNIRDFLIIGEGPDGRAAKLESFRLATDSKSFWDMAATPRKSADHMGRAFAEYLKRALTQSVALREPKDVAWFIASYARDALNRVEDAGALPALANVRASLEEVLGVTFEAERGARFFRSTLVQTLFYGVFSAWVLFARQTPVASQRFDWRTAVWHLTVPFIRTLFAFGGYWRCQFLGAGLSCTQASDIGAPSAGNADFLATAVMSPSRWPRSPSPEFCSPISCGWSRSCGRHRRSHRREALNCFAFDQNQGRGASG